MAFHASMGALLLIALGGDAPEPAVAPGSSQPAEAAIAPARVDNEAAGGPTVQKPGSASPEPVGAQPVEPVAEGPAEVAPLGEPEPEPAPEPEPGGLPSADAPVAEPSEGGGLPTWGEAPVAQASDPETEGWAVEEEFVKPPPNGVGLYSTAALLFGTAITKQWVMEISCGDDAYCGGRGLIDDFLMFGAIGFAGAGGWKHGEHIRWKAEQAGKPAVVPRGRQIAGWTVFAIGMAGLITDLGLYQACYSSALGPYTQIDGFRYTCSPAASIVVTDVSGLAGAIGAGLGMSAQRQIRASKVDVSIAPAGGRGRVGLSLTGRF